jgi:hypothetical protein
VLQAFLPANYRNWELKDMKLTWKQVLLERKGSILPVEGHTAIVTKDSMGKKAAAYMSVLINKATPKKLRPT